MLRRAWPQEKSSLSFLAERELQQIAHSSEHGGAMRLPLQQAERGIDAALPQMRGQNLAGQPACIWPIRARPAFARTRLDQNAALSNFHSGRTWQYGSSAEPERGETEDSRVGKRGVRKGKS